MAWCRLETLVAASPDSRNRVQPKVTKTAMEYSGQVYRLARITVPQSITGTILAVFARVCTGKVTYLCIHRE